MIMEDTFTTNEISSVTAVFSFLVMKRKDIAGYAIGCVSSLVFNELFSLTYACHGVHESCIHKNRGTVPPANIN